MTGPLFAVVTRLGGSGHAVREARGVDGVGQRRRLGASAGLFRCSGDLCPQPQLARDRAKRARRSLARFCRLRAHTVTRTPHSLSRASEPVMRAKFRRRRASFLSTNEHTTSGCSRLLGPAWPRRLRGSVSRSWSRSRTVSRDTLGSGLVVKKMYFLTVLKNFPSRVCARYISTVGPMA